MTEVLSSPVILLLALVALIIIIIILFDFFFNIRIGTTACKIIGLAIVNKLTGPLTSILGESSVNFICDLFIKF